MTKDEFIFYLSKEGINCSTKELNLLDKYYHLLISWNKKINLTTITIEKEVYLKHFFDSLTICKAIDLNKVDNLCDIGTGAGFPGIVLKIFYPNLKITLIDSQNKRINFLQTVCEKLSLSNITIIHARAEEYAQKNKNKFDVVVARAVASLPILLEYTTPIVKINGVFIAYKGQDEINNIKNATKELNCTISNIIKFSLPHNSGKRTLIIFKKNKNTPKKYPRRYAEIKRKPL